MTFDAKIISTEREGEVDIRVREKGVSFYRNCGAAGEKQQNKLDE